MNPDWYPYNNLTVRELLLRAEAEGNTAVLAMHYLMQEELNNTVPATHCDECDDMRDVLHEVYGDASYSELDSYTRMQVEEHI